MSKVIPIPKSGKPEKEILLGEKAGFCMGVKNAVEQAKKEVEKQSITYCLGELTHNPEVMKNLEEKGLRVIEDLSQIPNPKGKKVIFRAHGVTKQVYEEAKKLGLEIVDLTCPNVLAIHKIAEQAVKEEKDIFLIGEKKHPETIGTASFCGKNHFVIETQEDLQQEIQQYLAQVEKNANSRKLVILSQTTFHLEKFKEFENQIQEKLANKVEIEVRNTICKATRLRQEETMDLAKQVEYMIIIGGRKSSNTNKLFQIALQNCAHAVMIENEKELSEELLQEMKKYQKIGVMAGASTPDESIQNVINKIRK